MAHLPEEGMYRIDNSDLHCATILLGNALHGQNANGTNVMLQYTIRDQGLCTLRVDDQFLGVNAIRINEPVILVDQPHLWILEQINNVITIRYAVELNGVQCFWRICSVGQPVLIHDNPQVQTWEFNL